MVVIIHHNEIILKGRNRSYFEKKLIENIKRAFLQEKIEVVSVKRDEARIICNIQDETNHVELIKKALMTVFGIKNFAIAVKIPKNIDAIKTQARIYLEILKNQNITKIRPITKRSDKSFPLNSPEINAQIGEIANELGIKVQYKPTIEEIYTEVTTKSIYMFISRMNGLGGLPQGTAGKVLCLHSGGIDSPVSAYLMMKRGCQVDYLHFHSLRENKEVISSKIAAQVKILNKYQDPGILFTIPYHTYQLKVLGNINEKYEVVIFRNFMILLAQKLAHKLGYKALIMGDSVGQVASQTLENIAAANINVEIPILRPLISFDKQEIIDIAKKISTYEESIKKYKDCCSIIARKPATRISLDQIEKELGAIDMNKIIDESFDEMDEFLIK
jgi:tRNA uracil 4-sulfurtransferase